MTKMNQISFDSMKATRAVEVAEAIFETLPCGMEVPYTLLADAEELGLSVEAIQEKVDELYGTDEEETDDFI
ncbi:hypothetical protein R4596rev_00026 [Escherichia phage vB_EcoP_R4596]|uniref:Uncharacterized protein n=1 Tax=Escherichia phage vB_EcoP_R4596 TaxID=2508204 RepID=A0A482MST8_9CAUD|nr:hypothetical protein R4596rev_00026 [Escherichia phage vB_EcoP_R4596]